MTTNRERLNQMTNEELANILAYNECYYCVYGKNSFCGDETDCRKGILQWLNQESEE